MKFLRALTLAAAAVLAAGFLLHASGCADSAFYQPTKTVYSTPAQAAGIAYEDVTFKSADGTRLTGWFMPAQGVADARQAKGTVIHFHGNGGNIASQWRFAGWLTARGFNVLVFDYRGYGASEGSPSPEGCFEDSNAALDYVRTRPGVDPARLLVFGQSLGGNHAIAAVGAGNRTGVRALAAESTFFSYPSVANDHIPGLGLLVSDRYSAKNYIAAIAPIPLLLIHGTDDKIVPYAHATRLLAAAGEPKQLITIEGGGHIAAMVHKDDSYRDALVKFFEDALNRRP